jgi:Skp family chaperone for outer membrane proteins
MPDYTATNPQTGETVRWDGKSWIPVPKPSAINRGITSLAGIPEGTDINPESKGFYAGAGNLGNYITALKQAITGLNPLPSMSESEQTAESRFKQPGWANKVTGTEEFLESGVPWAGPATVRSHEQIGRGDIAGGVGSAAGAGLTVAGLGKSAPSLAERLTPSSLSEMARKPVAGLLDVGENFEARAKKEHEEALATLTQKYEEEIQQAGKKTSESEAAYRTKVEQAKDEYSRKLAENEKKKIEASAKQTGAETKKKALTTQPRSGPVYQRLAGMADQIATQDVPKLDKDVRAAQNSRWNAFRMAIGDTPGTPKMVDWTPVQQAVVDAETNILQGSPENIAIFRNILREGVNPLLEKATVFKKTAGSLEDLLSNKNLTEEGRARLISQLGEESQFETRGGSGPIGSEQVSIPFDDARGYYTELNQKIYRSRSLPGDVRRALKSVQETVDKKAIQPIIPREQITTYNTLKSDWGQYMSDFYDSDGPLAQLKNSATSDGRLNLITGSKGANIIDALGRYARFNPNVTGLAGRLRSMMKQIRELPSVAPSIPGPLRPPRLPSEPKPVNLSSRPSELEPLDVTRAKLETLEKMPKTWGTLRPYQAVIPYYWPRLLAQKLISELLSHQNVREWIARAK